MNRAVRLVELTVSNVGVLVGSVTLGPFVEGINIIHGGNEAGKSTLVEALRIGLFERHGTRHQGIVALQPHGTRLAPEVEITLTIDGEQLRIHKRFLEKPMSTLWLGDGTMLCNREADEELLRRLEGRLPKKGAVSREDMGVWGLLWVTQDETAHADPGATLGEDVRGALADAVGRQVGLLTGGKEGERIRSRVQGEVARFYTQKRVEPTGILRDAHLARQKAEERLTFIEQSLRENEAQRERWTREAARLESLEFSLPTLRDELETARQTAQALHQHEARLTTARAEQATAEARRDARQREVEERKGLVDTIEQLSCDTREERSRLEAMVQLHAEREREGEVAEAALTAIEAQLEAQRAEREATHPLLARAYALDQVARTATDLARAEMLEAESAEVKQALERDALDGRQYDALVSLREQCVVLRSRLEAEGTRVLVPTAAAGETTTGGEGDAGTEESAGVPTTVWLPMPGAVLSVPGIGEAQIDPARPGLALACGRARETQARLREALRSAGPKDLQTARERRAARAVAEEDIWVQRARLAEVAPEGLEVLVREAAAFAERWAHAQGRLAEAERFRSALDRLLTKLGDQPIDDTTVDALRRLSHDVDVADAAWSAVGTQVTVRALDDLTVDLGDGTPATWLAAGQVSPWQIVRPTTMTIGNAELHLVPRGEDLVKAEARLEHARQALGTALQERSLESLAHAEELARARAETESARVRLEQRLGDAAPEGLDVLRKEVARLAAETSDLKSRVQVAREASARVTALEIKLDSNRMTEEAIHRLEALAEEFARCEHEVSVLAARVRWLTGPYAGQERPIAERGPLCAGPTDAENPAHGWEIIPGELTEASHLAQLERTLDDALERANACDLDDARSRWTHGLSLAERQEQLATELERLAPAGLAALRERHGAVLDALGDGPTETDIPSATALQALLEGLTTRIDALERERLPLQEALARHDAARRDDERALSELRVRESSLRHQLDMAQSRLGSAREVASDAALSERLDDAQRVLATADEALAVATTALADAAPELHRDEVARAEGALRAQEAAARTLRDSVVHLETLLDRAALDGHFEALGDARAEHAAAIEIHHRLEREARAARLLADLVEEAYAEAQRRYLTPVVNEVARYLVHLRPGTEIRMTQDLRLDKVTRRGIQEDFDQLSGGTREQLSVIVRIALARVFARDRRPLPLLLDDTLGWTDDTRFLTMVKILRDAAKELQVLILTCHGARFERLMPDYCADLDDLKRDAGMSVS
ncbi:AAA family ATPase [Chondromyces crocatus]|uniref:Rad50/SbcC-type AAA domain-containing protein n=1 Tax=Chondromyces crocatus TaxID=52 RepID=A0A0K1EGK5_CHOCO|nr:AAA family ATPase [Chondromyces crocatus]AKT40000.1 uncharacterized protein CMC5_041530 [Chondromyces crocatus]